MGGGTWDSTAYEKAAASRRARGVADFGHDSNVRSGTASGVHTTLDPLQMKNPDPQKYPFALRESRDSAEHPESLPIAMMFDVTGSMGHIPVVLQQKLKHLMDVVIDKAGISDPQILVGAIGDATCDRYPLQVGQFESDNSFDEQLRNIIIEGRGGGQNMESYALAYRFAADHTATDAFEKRGKKGYFFTMGDEMPWPTVTANEAARLFGVQTADDESVEDLISRASERWEIFHLFSEDGGRGSDAQVQQRWQELLGERFIPVSDSSLVCEVIAGIIYMMESAYNAQQAVNNIGLSGSSATSVLNALKPVSACAQLNQSASVSGGSLAPSESNAAGITVL